MDMALAQPLFAGARALDRAALNANRTVHMNRRKLLGLAGMTLAGTALLPAPGRAQTPKRGGTIVLRLWDPPHFDPYLQVSYKTPTRSRTAAWSNTRVAPAWSRALSRSRVT